MAALVHELTDDAVSVSLVNVNQTKPREVLVQAGGYAEHRFTGLEDSNGKQAIDAGVISVRLAPGAGQRLKLHMKRYADRPDLSFPWARQ